MNTLSAINKAALEPLKLIEAAENKYHKRVDTLANEIISRECKIVLLAGPSGSGKTTSAHILKNNIISKGHFAEIVSLDNFYLPDSKMPLLKNGEPDYETVYSLDIEGIHKALENILNYGKAMLPVYDFTDKEKETEYHEIDINNGGILIIEGLHALNPILTEKLTSDSIFKIYVSVNCSIYDDNGDILLTSRKLRLARRISRDYIYRNTSAERTLKLWTAVVEGEEKYLYPYKDTADAKLLTFHAFEPCIFKDIFIKLFSSLPETADNYEYASLTKSALEKFVSIDYELVPENSLIREFLKR